MATKLKIIEDVADVVAPPQLRFRYRLGETGSGEPIAMTSAADSRAHA